MNTSVSFLPSSHLRAHCRGLHWLRAALAGAVMLSGHVLLAQTQPANSLSIVTYGANTSSSNNTTAIQNCFNAAQSQGKGVWIPAGTWQIQGSLTGTDLTISGAGKTSSIIYRLQNSSSIVATHLDLVRCTVRDIGIDGNGTARGVNASYGILMKGVGWLVERVKISHSDAGMWMSGSNGTVQNCEVVYSYADGININNADGPNNLGAYLTVKDSYSASAGDDGFAINSQGVSLGRQNMQDPKILNCTSVNAYYANGIRIAGGVNSTVQNSQISGVTKETGLVIAKFGADGFPTINASVTGNTIDGSGSLPEQAGMKIADGSSATITGNTIRNSAQAGFLVANGNGGGTLNFTFSSNTIDHPAQQGILILAGAGGTSTFQNNTVLNLNAGQQAFQNSSTTMSASASGNSWQTTSGATFYQDYSYGGTASQVLPVGTYTTAQLAARGMPNDWASSVRVSSGRTVIMYANDNFTGQSWTRTADTPNFGSLSPNANDMVSSVKVQ